MKSCLEQIFEKYCIRVMEAHAHIARQSYSAFVFVVLRIIVAKIKEYRIIYSGVPDLKADLTEIVLHTMRRFREIMIQEKREA